MSVYDGIADTVNELALMWVVGQKTDAANGMLDAIARWPDAKDWIVVNMAERINHHRKEEERHANEAALRALGMQPRV